MNDQPRAIGIDVSAGKITIAQAIGDNPRKYPASDFQLVGNWRLTLSEILRDAIVVIEPTGYHYSAPIIRCAISAGASVWQINHEATGDIRNMHVSNAKTDKLDAQALAYVANEIRSGKKIRAVRHNANLAPITNTLRHLVNRRESLLKLQTQTTNRLKQLGYNLDPQLADYSDSWMRAILEANAVTPSELIAVAGKNRPKHITNGQEWRGVTMLANRLHPEEPEPELHPLMRHTILSGAKLVQSLQKDLADLEASIFQIVHAEPFTRVTTVWLTVPNLNEIGIASLLVATAGDPASLEKGQFAQLVGSAPRTNQSGSSLNETSAKRKGYRPALRTMFFLTMSLIDPHEVPNAIRDYFHTIQTKRKAPACRRKLAGILYALARSGEPFRYIPPKK